MTTQPIPQPRNHGRFAEYTTGPSPDLTLVVPAPRTEPALPDAPPFDPDYDLHVPADPADLDLLPPADIDQCGPCNGSGEVYAGYDEIETGMPVTVRCESCWGTGQPR